LSRGSEGPRQEIEITAEAEKTALHERIAGLRACEPQAGSATAAAVEAFLTTVAAVQSEIAGLAVEVDASDELFLRAASQRQVDAAAEWLKHDRLVGLEILSTIFRLGTVPAPDGRYNGELVAISTGLLSDPFFEWLTRIYLPWLGKTFDAASGTGDNVFVDNAWSKATSVLGWPEYRVRSDDPPDTVRVFPFRSYEAPGIEDPNFKVLRIDYSAAPNPLPVRRVVDEIVALPGGYILGKAHMRGLREFRRVAFFSLSPAPQGPSPQS
jgi:hypothetical protein